MIRPTEPTYTDPAHPIYGALPLADALDVLDRQQVPSDMSPAAISIEALLIDAGEAAGGLSTDGFRHDLIQHVVQGERDQDEALFDEAASRGWRGFYDHNKEPGPEAYAHGRALAEQWTRDVMAVLSNHGLTFNGEIIALMAEAA